METVVNQYQIISEDNTTEVIISKEVINLSMIGGDMTKNIYDTDYNGVIDTCEYIDCGTF